LVACVPVPDPSPEPAAPDAAWGLAAGGCSDRVCVELDVVDVPVGARRWWEWVVAPALPTFTVLPGKALAATAVSAPVIAVHPATSQRLQTARRRSAASRVPGVWPAAAPKPRFLMAVCSTPTVTVP